MPQRELVRDLGPDQAREVTPAAFAAKHRGPSTIDAGSVNLQILDLSSNDWYFYRGQFNTISVFSKPR